MHVALSNIHIYMHMMKLNLMCWYKSLGPEKVLNALNIQPTIQKTNANEVFGMKKSISQIINSIN